MKTVSVSDDLDALLATPEVKAAIKSGYITKRLFVDSAIRQGLRKLGVPSEEEIVAHLQRLAVSKSRHLDQQRTLHAARRAKDRQRKANQRLNETL